MIPLSEPCIEGNEWQYIKSCLDSSWVSSAGEFVTRFEQELAQYVGVGHAVACSSGTAALQVALRLVGVENDNEVIVPTLTFIAPVNAIIHNAAVPVFMDCDQTYCIDPEKTAEFIISRTELRQDRENQPFSVNKKTGRKIGALLPVHVWGNAANLDDLIPLCHERGIPVVEDASESLGTSYCSGSFSGSHTGTIGKAGCLSFNGNKILTTGGGGMILTNDKIFAERARYLTTQAKDDPIKFIHNEIGYNYRLTNLQAAMGVAQLEQLPSFLRKKARIHREYVSGVGGIRGLSVAEGPAYANNNHWLNVINIEPQEYADNFEALMNRLSQTGIESRPVWALNHLQLPYKDCERFQIEMAERLVQCSLCLPSSSNLNSSQIDKVLGVLRRS